jgi:hypothetical protein
MAMPPRTVSDAAPIKANAMILALMSNILSPDTPQMTGSSGHLAGRLPAIQRHLQRRQCRRRIALTSCFQGAVKSASPSWSSRPIHGVAPAFSAGVRADLGKEVGRSRLGTGGTPMSAFKRSFPPNDRLGLAHTRPQAGRSTFELHDCSGLFRPGLPAMSLPAISLPAISLQDPPLLPRH